MSKRNISQVLSEAELSKGRGSSDFKRGRLDSEGSNSAIRSQKHTILPYPSLKPPSQPPKPTPFQKPAPLTTFSYDASHQLHFDDSALRYYIPPPLPTPQSRPGNNSSHYSADLGVDLGYGYERWIRRPEERSRIDSLLRAVERVTGLGNGSSDGTGKMEKMKLSDVGVVAWRGVITRILTAPYEDNPRETWDMNVMLVNGTLYLEEHRSEEMIIEKNNIKPHHRKMMYYGYAFESYCTTDAPPPEQSGLHSESQRTSSSSTRGAGLNSGHSHPSGWGGDVDTNVQWCSIVRTKLGDTKFIIGGEVDCVEGEYNGMSTDNFVELKTSMAIRGAVDEAKFEKKLLKFYFQSFLLGVPKIIVGFRSPNGHLTTTQTFQTMYIPRLLREKANTNLNGPNANAANAWNPSLCLDWCHNFLTSLKQTISSTNGRELKSASATESEGAAIWRVTFIPRQGAKIIKLDELDSDGSAVKEIVNGEDRVGFLPRWYWDEVCNDDSGITVRDSTVGHGSGSVVPDQPRTVGGWQI
ncbi:RAI1 like PD-XK nuclease-domain-containing protein [Rhodocollybia butyracea]|uniref:Decapping nuclease n=1 Tax=Rhodocollybia butyracea TaxID=206335 RepID=A0A9P5P651_9AGAR|nr:RAI1 like PD-XK nuclease-domain-containing protein [Rhodocollybia butyracea]